MSLFGNIFNGSFFNVHDNDEDTDVRTSSARTAKSTKNIEDILEKFVKNSTEKFGGLSNDKNSEETKNILSGMKNDGLKLDNESSSKLSGIGDKVSAVAGGIAGVINAIQLVVQVVKEMTKFLEAVNDQYEDAITSAFTMMKENMGTVNARLYGLGQDLADWSDGSNKFYEYTKEITDALYQNSYVDQNKLLENIASMVKSGVAFNVEERAFISTIVDSTVTTFNAMNDNLLQLIRVQQSDSTLGQFGAEAIVTKVLNGMFQDTSYLNGTYDAVYSAVYEANSQLTASEAVVWDTAIQEWLGALYSVGMSSDTVTSIATALNYLATGDASALTSNSTLNNLVAFGAQNAGLSYSSLFGNMTVENTTALLSGIIEQLQYINNNTADEIQRKAMADVLGVKLSDISAASNLTANQISTLTELSNGESYTNILTKAQEQVELLNSDTRTSIASRIENTYNNIMESIGNTIATDSSYTMRYYSALMEEAYAESIVFDLLDIRETAHKWSSESTKTKVIDDALYSLNHGMVDMSQGTTILDASTLSNWLNFGTNYGEVSEEQLNSIKNVAASSLIYYAGEDLYNDMLAATTTEEVREIWKEATEVYRKNVGVSDDESILIPISESAISNWAGTFENTGLSARTGFLSEDSATNLMRTFYNELGKGNTDYISNEIDWLPFFMTQNMLNGETEYESGDTDQTDAGSGSVKVGTGYSAAIKGGNVAADATELNILQDSGDTSATTKVVNQETTSEKTLDDIYNDLVDQSTGSIKVKLVDIEDFVVQEKLAMDQIKVAVDKISYGKIEIEGQENMNSILQAMLNQ